MHPAAFYFSCTYTNGISLRIIIKDYIITQTLIIETALNCSSNWVCNCKPKAAILKQFHSRIFFEYCSVLKITENQHWYIGPYHLHICCIASSYWFTNSTHYEMATFLYLQKNTLATLSDRNLQQIYFGGLCKNRKDTKYLNNFSCCIKKH